MPVPDVNGVFVTDESERTVTCDFGNSETNPESSTRYSIRSLPLGLEHNRPLLVKLHTHTDRCQRVEFELGSQTSKHLRTTFASSLCQLAPGVGFAWLFVIAGVFWLWALEPRRLFSSSSFFCMFSWYSLIRQAISWNSICLYVIGWIVLKKTGYDLWFIDWFLEKTGIWWWFWLTFWEKIECSW
jgi:hypothetical protein